MYVDFSNDAQYPAKLEELLREIPSRRARKVTRPIAFLGML
jgi:hypothetical protein